MQAILLAAGKSSRFVPFTDLSHKSLVMIMGKTLIEHTILALKETGIYDIIIVINTENEVKKILENREKLGVNITYIVQPEPLGMGDALLRAERYIKNDFFVLSPYHLDFAEFKKPMEGKKTNKNIVLLAKKDSVLNRYATIKTDGDRITDILEKPKKGEELSSLRLVAIYLLTKTFLKTLNNTPLEHYNFEKALSEFAKKEEVKFVLTDKDTVSLKYSWDILNVKNYLFKNLKRRISKKAKISKTAQITGNVYIEDNARIMDKASIKGPVFIGENAYVGDNAVLRDGVDLEENSVAGAFAEIKNSAIMGNSNVHSGFIGDSVIGRNCRIGAQFCTANKRIDRSIIKSDVKNEKIETGFTSLGTIVGNDVKVGIKSSTMPGVIIGKGAIIGPSTVVSKNVPENSKYYTKFQEIVVEK